MKERTRIKKENGTLIIAEYDDKKGFYINWLSDEGTCPVYLGGLAERTELVSTQLLNGVLKKQVAPPPLHGVIFTDIFFVIGDIFCIITDEEIIFGKETSAYLKFTLNNLKQYTEVKA